MLEHLEDGNDMGMRQTRDGLRLAQEAITLASRLAVWKGRLESDEPVEVYVTVGTTTPMPPRPSSASTS